VGAKSGQRRKPPAGKPAGRQRLALVIFGALFALLFVIFAVAEGLGAPSVPSGDVALVKSVPDEVGQVSEEEFERALEQQAAQGKLKKAPQPGDPKYDELKEAAMTELLNSIWLRGQAEELGITVTEKQVETELAKIKKESFPTPSSYNKFLKESHYTQEDVNDRVELQLLSTQIQQRISQEAPQPSEAQIAEYYEQEKATKFTEKASRDLRLVVNEDKSEIEAAQKALEKDNSPKGWEEAVGKYSSNPAAKAEGGLQKGVTDEGFIKEPLKAAIFDSATNELVGPVKYEKNWFLIEIVKLNPAKTKSLKEATSEISSTLSQEIQQEFFTEFVSQYESRWRSRTYCADGFVVEQCSNFKGDGRPSNAPPACYEANPKTPATACPSPVTPTKPALPGTVTLLKPKGEPFVQRPLPETAQGEGSEAELAPEGEAPPAEAGGAAEESGSAGE
jgi:parvulin-like peptidyl-prolyl isomerase